jgi:hypothetical protein
MESVREGVRRAARAEISMAVGVKLGLRNQGERKLLARVVTFNQRFEVILVDLDDAHLALRVVG